MNDKFSIFLLFPTESINISSKADGESLLKEIRLILDRIDCENNAELFYGSSNREEFSKILKLYENDDMLGYFGFLDFEEAMLQLFFESDIKDWEKAPKFSDEYSSIEYIPEVKYENPNIPCVLKEIAERLSIKSAYKMLLLNIDHDEFMSDPIQIKRFAINKPTCIVKIKSVSSFRELDNWFDSERTKRNYNYNDFRHIQGHPDYRYYNKKGKRVGKSPLLGGLAYRKNADEILQTALGDLKEHSFLINWDTQNECYMRFEDENVQNMYHGYHLVDYQTHQRDKEEEKRISRRVLAIISYRKNNS